MATANPRHFFDTFINFVSGLGTSKDKNVHTVYTFSRLDDAQLEAAYRTDWIARKVVDIPAADATREWRSWQGTPDQIEKLEEIERSFNIRQKVNLGLRMSRLYGGAALILGVDVGKPDEPLDISKVGAGALKFTHVVPRISITAGPIDHNILSPFYGQPAYYENSSPLGIHRIHSSRVIRFIGSDIITLANQPGDEWGDSVLQTVDDAIKNAGVVSGGIATLIQESKLDIIKLPNLTTNIATQEYRDALTTRFTYANVSKSIINALLLDKEEEWERVSANFSGMPDLMKLYFLIASGAADIPATRMLSQSPAGLSSTGESDTRNYYDRISSDQNITIRPTISPLDEILIRSALGDRDPSIFYNWNPLWQLSDEEKAKVAKSKAEVFKIDVDSALIDPDVLRQAREAQLIDDGTYPGLEGILEEKAAQESEEPVSEEETETEEELLMAPTDKKALADSRLRSLYIRRDVVNADEIIAWAKSQGFTTTLPADDMHVTVVFSRAPIDWAKLGDSWSGDENGNITIRPGGFRMVEQFDGGAIVLLFSSTDLQWRHGDAMRLEGATWDFPEYQPHITITYDKLPPGKETVDDIEPYRGRIILGPEIFEEVNEQWKSGIVEEKV